MALESRNKARYKYEISVSEEMAQETIALARELLEHLKVYLAQEQGASNEQKDD